MHGCHDRRIVEAAPSETVTKKRTNVTTRWDRATFESSNAAEGRHPGSFCLAHSSRNARKSDLGSMGLPKPTCESRTEIQEATGVSEV